MNPIAKTASTSAILAIDLGKHKYRRRRGLVK
jgi:hypothetical protein